VRIVPLLPKAKRRLTEEIMSHIQRAAVLVFIFVVWPSLAKADPVVGIVEWEPGVRRDANQEDKTDYWAAIGYSSSTGKFGSSCKWMSRDNASRIARENCNAKDAECVVLCCNGWCAIALGDNKKYGVGWGANRAVAEKHALAFCKEQTTNAKVVFSINSREMRSWGVIAYSTPTGAWGYATGGRRTLQQRAINASKDADAKVIAAKFDCWMALALGDDKSVYGFGYAGNRIDAEKHALEECGKRTKNAKIVVSFCTNGVES
jgi:hypothetical protein